MLLKACGGLAKDRDGLKCGSEKKNCNAVLHMLTKILKHIRKEKSEGRVWSSSNRSRVRSCACDPSA